MQVRSPNLQAPRKVHVRPVIGWLTNGSLLVSRQTARVESEVYSVRENAKLDGRHCLP
jgi:hypothetical protein